MTTLPADEDEFTELVDADFPRVDLVGKGANGIPRFLIAKQDGHAGLLDPGFVRDLIAKAEPEPVPGSEEQVTMTGSPGAIAALIHSAAVAKAKNDTADRQRKAASGAAMENGSYPIASEADLTKAIHAVGRGGSSHNAIRKHIISRARSLGASSKIPDNWNSDGSLKGDSVSKAGTVAKDAGDMLDAQTDDGMDGMDPTVPLAAPDEDAPGDPTDPGSPAWEAIDAATAQKWCAILSRARVAMDLLAERELLECASGDSGDAGAAYDLQDACCAIDYAISVLAPFAVSEQSEADCGSEELAMIGKAAADETLASALFTIESLGAVIAKAGRVLSSVNEKEIRSAAASLNKVLSSLPMAPVAEDIAKEKETAVDDGQKTAEPAQDAAVAKEAGDAPAAQEGAQEAPQAEVAKADGDPAAGLMDAVAATAGEPVAKADDGGDGDAKAKMVAVFDSKGNLVGVVDPSEITPVQGADAPAKDDGEVKAEPAPDASDMTPAPAAEAGTPADAVAKEDQEAAPGLPEDPQAVLKSIVTDAVSALLDERERPQEVRKADLDAALEEIRVLKERLETVENTPAAPKVFTNGAEPPPGTLRGQDRARDGGQPVDVAKARELKDTLYHGTPAEQNQAFNAMQEAAIAGLAAIHGTRR